MINGRNAPKLDIFRGIDRVALYYLFFLPYLWIPFFITYNTFL